MARVMGGRHQRLDGPQKVTGTAKYSHDINLPGMLYGVIVRTQIAAGRITAVNLDKAMQLPGVKAVIPLGRERVRYAGEEVAAIAAVSEEIARHAAELVEITYETERAAANEQQAREMGMVRGPRNTKAAGDPDKALAEAEAVVEAEYSAAVNIHHPLEAHGQVVQIDGGKLTAWSSTQGVNAVKSDLTRSLQNEGITDVRVIAEYIGGGFGAKLGAWPYAQISARLAKSAGAPVKLMLDRKEQSTSVGNKPSIRAKVKIGGTKNGKITSFVCEASGMGGVSGGADGYPLPYIYNIPNVRVEQTDIQTNTGRQAAFRAPGHPQASFVTESAIDELAYKLGVDPLELRLAHDADGNRRRMLQEGAELLGWKHKFNPKPGAGAAVRKRGVGCAVTSWGSGGGGTQATVIIRPDGSVEAYTGTQDIGTGTLTLVAISVAEVLGLQPRQVRTRIGDTDLGVSGGSGGSSTAPSVAPAFMESARQAGEQLLAACGASFGVDAPELVFADGNVLAKNSGRKISFKDACAYLGSGEIKVTATARGVGGSPGAQLFEVEVDTETGAIYPIKVVAMQSCGRVVNELTAESQVIGGIIMGIGYALTEERIVDPQRGIVLNSSLETYKLPGSLEMPEFVVRMVPLGDTVIGVGEPPHIPTASALANAVFNATGWRVREIPMTKMRVLRAKQAAARGA